jgi:hypothetical protein
MRRKYLRFEQLEVFRPMISQPITEITKLKPASAGFFMAKRGRIVLPPEHFPHL